MYQPIESPPCSERIRLSLSAISVSATSQETRSKPPDGVRLSGCRTRSGSFWTSVIAMPLGQANPAESGWSGSGRSFARRPSETVATIPQSGSQTRQ